MPRLDLGQFDYSVKGQAVDRYVLNKEDGSVKRVTLGLKEYIVNFFRRGDSLVGDEAAQKEDKDFKVAVFKEAEARGVVFPDGFKERELAKKRPLAEWRVHALLSQMDKSTPHRKDNGTIRGGVINHDEHLPTICRDRGIDPRNADHRQDILQRFQDKVDAESQQDKVKVGHVRQRELAKDAVKEMITARTQQAETVLGRSRKMRKEAGEMLKSPGPVSPASASVIGYQINNLSVALRNEIESVTGVGKQSDALVTHLHAELGELERLNVALPGLVARPKFDD